MNIIRLFSLLTAAAFVFCPPLYGAEKTKTIMFVGDSISCGIGASNSKFRFSTVVTDALNKEAGKTLYIEKNVAISGSTMTDQPWPSEKASGYPYRLNDVLKQKPDILVIQHGSNDCGLALSMASYAWSYRHFVREVKAALPGTLIVCQTLPPLTPNPAANRFLNEANAAIQEIAALENTVVSQANLAFANQTKDLPDFCHPNDAGHKIIAGALLEAIRQKKVQNIDRFDFAMPSPGKYSVCGWQFNIPAATAKAGCIEFRNIGRSSFEYRSYGQTSVASPLNYHGSTMECKSLDPAVTPEYKWNAYQKKSSWKLPSTNGKWVKITYNAPQAANFVSDFTSLDTLKKEWIFSVHPTLSKMTVADGVLSIDTLKHREIRIISRRKFKYAKIEAKVNFSYLGKGTYTYFGFVTPVPWHSNAVWIMNCNNENGTMYVTANKTANKNSSEVRTGNLTPGQWHDLVIDRAPDGVSLYVNGVLRGKVTDKTILPDAEMPIMFIVNSPEKSVVIQIKELKLSVY